MDKIKKRTVLETLVGLTCLGVGILGGRAYEIYNRPNIIINILSPESEPEGYRYETTNETVYKSHILLEKTLKQKTPRRSSLRLAI